MGTLLIRQTDRCPMELQREDWSIEDFEVVQLLGGGHLASVALCLCSRSGHQVVIKTYRKDRLTNANEKQVAREVKLPARLNHPNVVAIYAVFEDTEGIYVVQEYAEGADLFSELGRHGGHLPEERVASQIIRPFVSALASLHAQGILHRDIKPENILLTGRGEVRLADFGLAMDINVDSPRSCVGTLDYMPPEMAEVCLANSDLAARDSGAPLKVPSYGLPADIWATGILAYELLVGGSPFEADTKEETYDKIMGCQLWLPSHLSQHAQDFIRKALRINPVERPTASELFEHPWLRQGLSAQQ